MATAASVANAAQQTAQLALTPLYIRSEWDNVAQRTINIGDITLHDIDEKNARVIFEILNQRNVDRFLNNKALQEFLTAPLSICLPSVVQSFVQRGARLTIACGTAIVKNKSNGTERTINTLIIGRQLKSDGQTIMHGARFDLFRNIFAFIIPITKNNYNDVNDILGGLTANTDMCEKMFFAVQTNSDTTIRDWVRAEPFVLNHKTLEKEDNDKMELDKQLNSFLPAFSSIPQICDHIAGYLDLPRKPIIDGVCNALFDAKAATNMYYLRSMHQAASLQNDNNKNNEETRESPSCENCQ